MYEAMAKGDQVFYLAPSSDKGAKKKMAKHWMEPYLVVEKVADVLYKIQQIPAGKEDATLVHVGTETIFPTNRYKRRSYFSTNPFR